VRPVHNNLGPENIDFSGTASVLDKEVFDVDMHDVRMIMTKFTESQKASAENDIRDVTKTIGEVLFDDYRICCNSFCRSSPIEAARNVESWILG